MNLVKKIITSLIVSAIVAMITGCANTAKGAAKDTSEMGEGMKEAGDNVAETASDVATAAKLTPMVKSAIISNPTLNDSGNSINVDTDDDSVTLSGTVKSEKAKTTANEIAAKIIAENGGNVKLVNRLVVQP